MNYDPGMIRSLVVLTAVVTMAFAGTAAVAGAEPNDPGCSYTLTPPHLVQLSGTTVVTATLSPAACNRSNGFISVACLQQQGSSNPEKCAQGQGILPAQIFFQPYQPGATYVSTGRGCASTGNPPHGVCQTTGPLTATL